MVQKYARVKKGTTNTVKGLKYGAGEGRRRSVGPIASKMKEYCIYNKGGKKHPTYNKKKEG
jgi:hypothetical protein